MYNDRSDPTLYDCTFYKNSIDIDQGKGGGMFNGDCAPILLRCTFRENFTNVGATIRYGGGIYNLRSSPILSYCHFIGNASGKGGGIFSASFSPIIYNCLFLGNTAVDTGSAIYSGSSAEPIIVNSVFTGNSSQAGTIYSYGGSLDNNTIVINCTIFGNTSNATDRAGILNVAGRHAVIHNSILWGNGRQDEAAQIFLAPPFSNVPAATAELSHSCVQGLTGALGGIGNIGVDPMLIDPDGPDNILGTEDDNLQLHNSSPAIDAGDNNLLPQDTVDLDEDGDTTELLPVDLWGFVRIYFDSVDMGAYEHVDCNGNGVPDNQDISDGTSGDCNNNIRPDECESAEDCNLNGVQDFCDLAEGTSKDCNDNQRLDDCDISLGISKDCDVNQVPDSCDIAEGTSQDINHNQIPDLCEVDCNNNGLPDVFEIVEGLIPDCNNNTIPDDCEMMNRIASDCNDNNVLDTCDIADGTSFDVNNNCIPDECNQYPMPLAEEFPINKNRFISFTPVNYSCNTAIRVTLSSLHHPDPPTINSPDFSEFEGQVRWAGSPNTFTERDTGENRFRASSLQCEPYFTDWSSVSLLHLFGDAIVPSSMYLIEVVGDDCFDLNDPACYSDPLEVRTGRWGDIVLPIQNVDGSHQPTIEDVLAAVGKWLGNLKPIKAQTLLQNNVPDPSQGVSVDDILMAVNAWLSSPYPFAGPSSCMP